jgi:endogenous inhibitor of DNA gyrase (YacG/DUF329 family)
MYRPACRMSHTGVYGTGARRHAARNGGVSTFVVVVCEAPRGINVEPGGPGCEGLDSLSVRVVRCPSCRRETRWEGNPQRPFCSERCRLLDLAAWADERYRIAGHPVPTEPELPGHDAPTGRTR